jgi:hypothetical protein
VSPEEATSGQVVHPSRYQELRPSIAQSGAPQTGLRLPGGCAMGGNENPSTLTRNFSPASRVKLKEASKMLKRLLAVCLLGAAFAAISTRAHADSDDVHFFDDIQIPAGSTAHDTVCFFCSVEAQGEVNGDMVVFFGDIHIAGKADHDVVNFFGSVSADNNAQIGNDLVSFFGLVHLGQNASVGRDMVSMFGDVEAPDSVSVGHDRVAFPFWILLLPLILIGGIITLIVHEVRALRWRRYQAYYPYPPFPPQP